MGLCRDITKLDPSAQAQARAALAELDAKGIKYFVNETLRTPEVQACYYAQGRKTLDEVNALRKAALLWPLTEAENGHTVTQTLKSVHLTGHAMDVVPADDRGNPLWSAPQARWTEIAAVMKAHGWEWGGDWAGSWDKPHYQIV
jgi:peptidoglycan L-alanyl-D-glutamate endopeptidase CwlK